MESHLKRGKPVNGQAREIIYNVYQYCLSEAKHFGINAYGGYFNKVRERVSKATGVTQKFILRLLNEKDELGLAAFQTPPKKIKPKRKYRLKQEQYDYTSIRNMIYDMQLKSDQPITKKKVRSNLRETKKFQGGPDAFNNILKEMGFVTMTTDDNRKLLAEIHEVRIRRLEFIKEMAKLRATGKDIVYILDEIYVNTYDIKGKPTTVYKNGKIKAIYAGNEKGFLPGTLLLQEYQEKEMSDTYNVWVSSQLIPNLSPDSVLVIDEAPYHMELLVEPPNAHSQKKQMTSWLEKHDIPFDKNSTKSELFAIINSYKDKNTEFKFDCTLRDFGHSVLRLPPYHSDFNPMKTISFQIKEFVTKNAIAPMTLVAVEELIMEKMHTFKPNDWKQIFDDVVKCEDKYLKFEPEFDNFSDNFEIKITARTKEEEENSDIEMASEDSVSDSD